MVTNPTELKFGAHMNIKHMLIPTLLSVFLLILASNSFAESAKFEGVNHQEFASLNANQNPMIIDVRTPEEYAQGHVPGAINVPLATVSDNLDMFSDKQKPVVMYCRSGRRAAEALGILADAGNSNLYHLEGDIAAWEEAGKPMEMPE